MEQHGHLVHGLKYGAWRRCGHCWLMGFPCRWVHALGCCGRGWAGARWADRGSCDHALYSLLGPTKRQKDTKRTSGCQSELQLKNGAFNCRCEQTVGVEYLYWMWERRSPPAGILEAAESDQTGREPYECSPQRLLLHTEASIHRLLCYNIYGNVRLTVSGASAGVSLTAIALLK